MLNLLFNLQGVSIEHDGYVNDPNHEYFPYPGASIPYSFVGSYISEGLKALGLMEPNKPNFTPPVPNVLHNFHLRPVVPPRIHNLFSD